MKAILFTRCGCRREFPLDDLDSPPPPTFRVLLAPVPGEITEIVRGFAKLPPAAMLERTFKRGEITADWVRYDEAPA